MDLVMIRRRLVESARHRVEALAPQRGVAGLEAAQHRLRVGDALGGPVDRKLFAVKQIRTVNPSDTTQHTMANLRNLDSGFQEGSTQA